MIINDDVFNVLPTIRDNSISLVFCDPPYNLSSKIFIDTDGKPKYKSSSDFMNKWDGLSAEQLEIFFKECFRTCKFGAYVVMYGIDRQQMPFEFYSLLAGFEAQQYLYSYKISSFPKSIDCSKMLDKREGAERGFICENLNARDTHGKNLIPLCSSPNSKQNYITSSSDLAKKYDGYKYSISPMKQVLETIMVFKKPYEKGMSTLDAIYAYEEGNKEIHPSIINIEGGRVPSELPEGRTRHGGGIKGNGSSYEMPDSHGELSSKRYPSQLFIVDDEKLKEEIGYNTSDILDKQSGNNATVRNMSYKRKGKGFIDNIPNQEEKSFFEKDSGGCSRILHKCLYSEEEYDILRYCTKVSQKERNAGCDELETKQFGMSNGAISSIKKDDYNQDEQKQTIGLNKINQVSNNHPTLKNLELSKNISKLFCPPVENLKDFTVLNTFSGAGSEYIGLLSNGVIEDNIIACEMNPEYFEISQARVKYWKDHDFKFRKEDKKELKKVQDKNIEDKKVSSSELF